MRKDIKNIPLHSLVIVFAANNEERSRISSKIFEDYEIISDTKVMQDLFGNTNRSDVRRGVWLEVKRRTILKLKYGERVVLDFNFFRQKERQEIARIAERYTAPVFYLIVGNETTDEFKKLERQIIRGDGLAEAIDGRNYNVKAIQKLPYDNLKASIKSRNYKGITVIPDVHGMYTALRSAHTWSTARNHFMVFLGDIIDYGPKPQECIDEVYDIVMNGEGCLVFGNHERKIGKWIEQDRTGNIHVKLSEGNKVTTEIIQKMSRFDREKFEHRWFALMAHARHHYIVDDTVFAHAGVDPSMFKNTEHRLTVREYSNLAMFGTIDEKNPRLENGDLNRLYDWCDKILDGQTAIVGHDIRSTIKPMIVNNNNGGETVFMDTGSGKSGVLTTADMKWDKKDGKLKITSFKRH